MRKRELIYFFVCTLMIGQTLCLGKGLSKAAKKTVENRYKEARGEDAGTFLVVTRKGIPAGLDAVSFLTVGYGAPPSPKVKKNIPGVEIKNGKITKVESNSEPISFQPGSLLIIERLRIKNDYIEIQTRTFESSPTNRDVPVGLNLYERARLKFYFDRSTMESDELEVVFSTIDEWLKGFDDHTQAFKYSRSISGPRIVFGMTFAQVEEIMGLPETKESDGNRVIYRYKDMTVEFFDGRSTRYAKK